MKVDQSVKSKKPRWVVCVCNLSAKEAETGGREGGVSLRLSSWLARINWLALNQ